MLTDRDRRVIFSIGRFKVLARHQIEKLHFPSYDTCQRRIREELKANNFISEPFYINVGEDGSRIPLYRLKTKGKQLYQERFKVNYRTPRWNYAKMPHLLTTNQLLIDLKLARLVSLKDINIEYELSSKINSDAYCSNLDVAIETDRKFETKNEIQKQFNNYQKVYQKKGIPRILVYYTARPLRLDNWHEEVANSNLEILFCKIDNLPKIYKLIKRLRRIKV